MCPREYNRIWAMSTYKNRPAFYLVPLEDNPTEQDLEGCIRTGRDLCKDLRNSWDCQEREREGL